jgi:hypothetical protein
VEAPRRLGLVISFANANRNVVSSPFGGPWSARIAITVTLDRHAGIGRGTLLTLRSTPLDASDAELAAFREAPIILTVDAAAMHAGGHAFYQAANGVWLTDHVPPGDLSGWPS